MRWERHIRTHLFNQAKAFSSLVSIKQCTESIKTKIIKPYPTNILDNIFILYEKQTLLTLEVHKKIYKYNEMRHIRSRLFNQAKAFTSLVSIKQYTMYRKHTNKNHQTIHPTNLLHNIFIFYNNKPQKVKTIEKKKSKVDAAGLGLGHAGLAVGLVVVDAAIVSEGGEGDDVEDDEDDEDHYVDDRHLPPAVLEAP